MDESKITKVMKLTDGQAKQINAITMESLEKHRTVELTAEMINEAVKKVEKIKYKYYGLDKSDRPGYMP